MHPYRTQVEAVRTVRVDHHDVRETIVVWVNAMERSIEVEDSITLLEYPGKHIRDWTVTRVLVTLREEDIAVPHELATLTSLHRLYAVSSKNSN